MKEAEVNNSNHLRETAKLQEEKLLVKAAYDESKANYEASIKESIEKTDLINQLQSEIAVLKLKNQPNEHLNHLNKKEEELEIVKQLVIEKDKVIKKMEESHVKEISALNLEKKAVEDALNCATRENTKIKDKENTLMDIFKSMQVYLDMCGKSGNNKNDSSPNQPNNWSCDQCNETFSSIDILNNHKRNNHISLKHTCTVCNHKAETKVELEAHVAHQHRNTYKCEECNFEDTNEESVLNHTIANHSIYICDLCDFTTQNEGNMNDHETSIHKKTKHTCLICKYSFNTQIKLREHKEKKHQEDIYPCDHCKFKADSIREETNFARRKVITTHLSWKSIKSGKVQ